MERIRSSKQLDISKVQFRKSYSLINWDIEYRHMLDGYTIWCFDDWTNPNEKVLHLKVEELKRNASIHRWETQEKLVSIWINKYEISCERGGIGRHIAL